MQDHLNTYEKAKPSLRNADTFLDDDELYFDSRDFNDTSARGTPSGICSRGQEVECFVLIVGVGCLLCFLLLLISWAMHFIHNIKVHDRAEKRRVHGHLKAREDDSSYVEQPYTTGRVNSDQILEDVVNTN